MIKRFIISVLLFSPTACNLAPHYKTPETGDAPAEFKESKDWKPAAPADAVKRGEWWKLFDDEALNGLEAQVADANQSLKAAVARLDNARAETREARADLFPTVNGDVGYTRLHNSRSIAGSTTATSDAVTTSGSEVLSESKARRNDYLLGADLTYEIDVWGRVRNEVAAAGDRAEASAADLATIDLSAHAELATDYFALRGDDNAQKILDQTVEAYGQALDLTKRRFAGGVISETDVDQAEAQFEDAKTQSADMHLKRSQLEHAIAVLIGKNPSEFTLAAADFNPKIPVIVPGLPSTLLERRPDVASEERLVAAANAEIGVAKAAWYPTFSLNGLLGFESGGSSSLLQKPSLYYSIGPSALLPLIDGGRISALNDEAKAAYEEAAANYKQTVLQAYQDVEDNLVAIHQLDSESKTQAKASVAADRALAQSQNRYNGGVAIFTDVVVAENTQLQAKLAANDITTRQLVADTQLIKALGGGWQVDTAKQ